MVPKTIARESVMDNILFFRDKENENEDSEVSTSFFISLNLMTFFLSNMNLDKIKRINKDER